MKRHLCLSILAAALAASAVPPALAGSEIVKCVGSDGRITLTDQPCAGRASTVRLPGGGADAPSGQARHDAGRVAPYPLAVEQGVLPPPPQRSAGFVRTRGKPLTRDIATLKAARAQFLLMDTGTRQTLATLD
ncbi:DUF4124 domain-containing protein [Massilia oculi]|uniref:DUF4124 domain-containing protein n=1 Tax=Massilia hydrophila TaxID=3044279 RepID=A0ABS7Y5X5_9BURK|nr:MULTISPECIES: DUF4124 domain-containing protein [Massilia]MCA1245009.1 DUF4124 domain-containing protein [Massilia sp. MS-15]MCA1855091.1 DUF4124 domain-containing protein [Massilia oculi]